MAYNENIPQATDAIQQSQGEILANFQALKQLIDVNHSTFGSATEGKHAKIDIPNLGVIPPFGAGDAILFNNTTPLTGGGQLFLKGPSTTTAIPITATFGTANGWAFLPSGILLKWGVANGTGLVTTLFPAGANFPVFASTFSAQVSVETLGAGDVDVATRISAFTNTQIQVYCSRRTITGAAAASFRYLIIGI